MKYIIIGYLLASAVLAVPFPHQGNAKANAAAANVGAKIQSGAGTAAGQQTSQTGQQSDGQVAQGQTGQTTQAGQNQNGQTGTAGQTQNGQNQNLPTAGTTAQGTPSADDLATAVSNWMADTSMVSNFLNTGKTMTNNVAFKQAATVALNAEVDELTHKAIIDQANGNDPNVQAANSTLVTGGAFQDVVDRLRVMSQQGLAAVNNIDLIDQNRCTNVLPNIDAYMASTGSQSRAVRPIVCDSTGIQGGVQSLGPTQPGGTPGTPQQAFDAAAALANGTGNGITPTSTGLNQTGTGTAGTGTTAGSGTTTQGTIPSTAPQAGFSGQAGTAGTGGTGATAGTQGAGQTAGTQGAGQTAGTQGTSTPDGQAQTVPPTGQQAGTADSQGQQTGAGASPGQAGSTTQAGAETTQGGGTAKGKGKHNN